MRAVGLKVLKNKLSEYVHDALLAEAVRAGIVTPPLTRSAEPPPRKPVMTTEELMRQLDESRADR